MKAFLALCLSQAKGEQLARTIPPTLRVEYDDGSLFGAQQWLRDHQGSYSPDILIIKRPEDYTVQQEIIELMTLAADCGVRRFMLLSNRYALRRSPGIKTPLTLKDSVAFVEYDRETWTRNLGVWEWEMMLEHLHSSTPTNFKFE